MCSSLLLLCFFFFKQKTAYEMRISDWSSDVCSSDLGVVEVLGPRGGPVHALLLQDRHVRVLEVLVGDADGPAGLLRGEEDVIVGGRVLVVGGALAHAGDLDARGTRDVTGVGGHREIGRASCRGRVCQYVEIAVAAGS